VKRIEDILVQCIEEIKAGNANMADCLSHYPDLRQELEPLLRIALSIKEPIDIRPSDSFKIRTKVNLMEFIHANRAEYKTGRSIHQVNIGQAWHSKWFKAVTVAVAAILVISALGVGTAYASQNSIPGDTLYPVKLGTEEFQRVLTTDDIKGMTLELKFASSRLEEMKSIARECPEEITVAITGYERNLDMAVARAGEVNNVGGPTSIMETLVSAISSHLSILDELEGNAPEAFNNAIRGAGETAIYEYMKVLRIMAQEDPLGAAEINMMAMEGRLSRARMESEKDNPEGIEKTLQQFEELRRFGEEISEITRGLGYDSRAVDELNARATAEHLEALSYIYGIVPEATKAAVEEAMNTSNEEHGQAVEELHRQGAPDDIPGEPPLPDEIPDKGENKPSKPDPKNTENGKR
jgi:hypothetical protein